MWGTTRPTQPMIPLIQTAEAVTIVEATMIAMVILFVSSPSA